MSIKKESYDGREGVSWGKELGYHIIDTGIEYEIEDKKTKKEIINKLLEDYKKTIKQKHAADEKEDFYDEEVHPNNKDFWKNLPNNPQHALGRHPVFTIDGPELDRASYNHTRDLANKFNVNHQNLGALFNRMQRLEQSHKTELEKLAIRAVSKLMQVSEDQLSAKLNNDVEINDTEPLEPEEMQALSPKLLDEANKRVTSNAFAQGASVHIYLTAHFLDEIEAAIKKIDPKLVDIYSKFSSGSHHLYWLMNMAGMNMASGAVGSVRPEQAEDGSIKMIANSPVFIVLVQELVKGVIELRYLKQLQEKSSEELSDEDIKKIYQYADKIEDEPKLIQIGPELWRRFLKVVNSSSIKSKMNLVDIYQHVIKLPPKELHSFVQLVVNKPEEAKRALELLFENKPDLDELLKKEDF